MSRCPLRQKPCLAILLETMRYLDNHCSILHTNCGKNYRVWSSFFLEHGVGIRSHEVIQNGEIASTRSSSILLTSVSTPHHTLE